MNKNLQFLKVNFLKIPLLSLLAIVLLIVGCHPAELPDPHTDTSPYYFKGEMDGKSFEWSLADDSSYVFSDYELQYNRIVQFQSNLAGINCQSGCPNSFQFTLFSNGIYQNTVVQGEDLLPVQDYHLVSGYELDTGLICKIIPQTEAPEEYIWNYGTTKPQLMDQDFYWNLYHNYSFQVCLYAKFACFPNTLTYTSNFDEFGNHLALKLEIVKQTADEMQLKVVGDAAGPLQYEWSDGSTLQTCTYTKNGYPNPYTVYVTNQQLSTKIQFGIVPDGNQFKILYQPFTADIYNQFGQSSKGKSMLTYVDQDGKKWSTLPFHQNYQDGISITSTSNGPINAENRQTTIVEFTFSGVLQDEAGNKKTVKNASGRIAVANPN
ncbi:MAG: hypothetical protein ABIV51_01385 [Saprospiraceae bacterium]